MRVWRDSFLVEVTIPISATKVKYNSSLQFAFIHGLENLRQLVHLLELEMSLDNSSCCHVHRLYGFLPIPYCTANNTQLPDNELRRVSVGNRLCIALWYPHSYHGTVELQEVKTLSICSIAGCTDDHSSSTWATCGFLNFCCKLRGPFFVPAELCDVDEYLDSNSVRKGES